MATSLGLTEVAESLADNLERGSVQSISLDLAIGVNPQIGQVLEFDKTLGAWKNFTSYDPDHRLPLAIFNDTILHDPDGTALAAAAKGDCIISGPVNIDVLLRDVLFTILAAGPVEVAPLLADAAATIAVGQVLQYNATEHNWEDFTAYAAGTLYAVCNETATIAVDTAVSCIIAGRVNLVELDATAQADADIEAGLLANGITPVTLVDSSGEGDESLNAETDANLFAALLPAIIAKSIIDA